MQNIIKPKLFWVTVGLLVLGVVSICLENIFYQYIDEEGVLHESFFMPLGMVFQFIVRWFGVDVYCYKGFMVSF